jgi:hypothetical protein
VFIVDESNALSVFIACEADFVKAVKAGEHRVELFFGNVLGNIANVQRDVCFVVTAGGRLGLRLGLRLRLMMRVHL